jgi:hypothetical protein
MDSPPWRGEAVPVVPPFGILLVVGSTTIAAMLFMTVLALAVVCRCSDRRPHCARHVAVAVPVLEVTGILQDSMIAEVAAVGAPADSDERAPILESGAGRANSRRGGTVAAGSACGAAVAEATVVIGRRA